MRCNGHMVNGGRCKHEAQPGSVMCHLHGAAAPQVRKRAAERLIMSADHASQKLLEWLDESYRAVAPRKLVDSLGSGKSAPASGRARYGASRTAPRRR